MTRATTTKTLADSIMTDKVESTTIAETAMGSQNQSVPDTSTSADKAFKPRKRHEGSSRSSTTFEQKYAISERLKAVLEIPTPGTHRYLSGFNDRTVAEEFKVAAHNVHYVRTTLFGRLLKDPDPVALSDNTTLSALLTRAERIEAEITQMKKSLEELNKFLRIHFGVMS